LTVGTEGVDRFQQQCVMRCEVLEHHVAVPWIESS
jgi:hypothetical protein